MTEHTDTTNPYAAEAGSRPAEPDSRPAAPSAIRHPSSWRGSLPAGRRARLSSLMVKLLPFPRVETTTNSPPQRLMMR